MKDEIKMIPIDSIRILNPRHRDRRKFEVIKQSIKTLGLKKPIQVSKRSTGESDEPGYDLVCGQGRIEACVSLGYKEIPAIVVDIPKDERLIRSLIENMARRAPSRSAMLHEVERLHAQGYNNMEIGRKLGISDNMVGGLLALSSAGEKRLLEAALTEKIPIGVAMDIARTDDAEAQRGLLQAYESKRLNGVSIRVVKKLIEQRRFLGKQGGRPSSAAKRTSAESLVSAYKRESQRQKMMIRKAQVCDAKLTFFVTAFKRLLADEHFVKLLQSEGLNSMPQPLSERIQHQPKEAP